MNAPARYMVPRPTSKKATGGALPARPRHMDQARRVTVGPERANGAFEQLQPGQFGRRPLDVIDLIDGVVIRKIGWGRR